MHPRLFRANRLLWAMVAALVCAAFPLVASADGGPVFSGQATAISGNALDIPLQFSDTGYQNSSEFAAERSGPGVAVANPTNPTGTLLSAETLHASTIAQGDRVRSEASLAEINLAVAGNSVGASFLMAHAMAVCTASGPVVSGNAELADLVVNGQPIAVGTAPNQSVNAGPVTVYINQQQTNSAGNAIDATALRVVVTDPLTGATLADVSFSHVHADAVCGTSPPNCNSPNDFVTGGGWIIPQSGSDKANFAVAGGWKDGGGWGHLEFIDHNTGRKIHGTGVTLYKVISAATRHIEGTADMDGQSVKYKVDATDSDATGDRDVFSLAISNLSDTPLYAASNSLGGGEIQIHHPCS
jgi:hypothetical protein